MSNCYYLSHLWMTAVHLYLIVYSEALIFPADATEWLINL